MVPSFDSMPYLLCLTDLEGRGTGSIIMYCCSNMGTFFIYDKTHTLLDINVSDQTIEIA